MWWVEGTTLDVGKYQPDCVEKASAAAVAPVKVGDSAGMGFGNEILCRACGVK